VKSSQIRARVEPSLKTQAEAILERIGLTPTQAITLYYRQIVLREGIPFEVALPNRETRDTFDRTDRGEDLRRFASTEEMFDALDL
jgi:DNA-damage-inducible protein J